MAKPRTTPETISDDISRVDPFREDEDDGGAAAPPLRPRIESDPRKPDTADAVPKRRKDPAQR